MKAIILAAGLGSRLGLKGKPKPLYEINGKPVIEHNILLLKSHGVKEIIINLHYKGDLIKNYVQNGSKWGVNVQYSLEEKLLGTAGAVRNVEWFFDGEPFFVVYGDNYTNINLTDMMNFHLLHKPIATIAVFNPDRVLNSGIAGGFVKINEDNTLTSFKEGNDRIDGLVNAGVYILEKEVLDKIPHNMFSDFGKDIFPKLLEEGCIVRTFIMEGFVFAIDTEEALAKTIKLAGSREDKYDNY